MNSNKPYLQTIESLAQWAKEQDKYPFWVIRNGFSTAKTQGVIMKNDEVDNIDDSVDLLIGIMENFVSPGARFTIQMTDKPGSSTYHRLVHFSYPSEHSGSRYPAAGIAGIGGIAGLHGGIEAYVDSRLEKERLERRIEELEAEVASPINKFESLSRGIGNMGIDLNAVLSSTLPVILSKIMGTPMAAAMNGPQNVVGISKEDQIQHLDNTIAQAMELKEQLENAPEQENDGAAVSQNNSIDRSLMRISEVFPDIQEFLEKLASFIETNPELAKTYFNA